MADDNAFAAAQLAAALIQAGQLIEKARGNTVEDATRLYFDWMPSCGKQETMPAQCAAGGAAPATCG